jgi:predicted peptidase
MFYQWKKDGVAGRWSSTPSLTINKTTAASAGKYVLVAVSPRGTVSSQEVTVSFSQATAKTAAAAK